MFPDDKLEVIRRCLKTQFSEHDLADQYDFDRVAQTFRISNEKEIYLVTVSKEFIDDHSTSEIEEMINNSHLYQFFKSGDIGRVIITSKGIKTET